MPRAEHLRRPRARGGRADPPGPAGHRRARPGGAPRPAAGVVPAARAPRRRRARCAPRRSRRASGSTRARSAARSSTSSTSGCVERTPDPDDGRATLLSASDDARAGSSEVSAAASPVPRRAARRLVRATTSARFVGRARPLQRRAASELTPRLRPARRRCRRAASAVERAAGDQHLAVRQSTGLRAAVEQHRQRRRAGTRARPSPPSSSSTISPAGVAYVRRAASAAR